jgi:hypothetical protein
MIRYYVDIVSELKIKHPVNPPEAFHVERLSREIGLLKVAMFPGVIGIDVAKDIDRGIAALNGCRRLIVDLRGNTGGDRRLVPHQLFDTGQIGSRL